MNRAVEASTGITGFTASGGDAKEGRPLYFQTLVKDYEIPDTEPYIRRLEKLHCLESAGTGKGGLLSM